MNGFSATLRGYPRNTSGLGQRHIPQVVMDMITLRRISASTSRGIYGLSWGSAFVGIIVVYTRTT